MCRRFVVKSTQSEVCVVDRILNKAVAYFDCFVLAVKYCNSLNEKQSKTDSSPLCEGVQPAKGNMGLSKESVLSENLNEPSELKNAEND